MAKIIDLDIVLPVIVEPVRPNLVEVGTPEIISVGSTSIEVSQSFSSDVEYYGGIYVGESADNNDDTTLVKNPTIISKTITGLSSGTTYYLNGVGIPILGNITVGEQISVTTNQNPIPEEYQLVEWLSNGGLTTQRLTLSGILDADQDNIFRKYDFYVRNAGGSGYGYFFGTAGSNIGWWEAWNGSSSSDGIAFNIPVTDDFVKVTVDLPRRLVTVDDTPVGFPVTERYYNLTTPISIYRRADNWQSGNINGLIQKIIVYGGENSDRIDFNLYPVYRKNDNKPGLYDIVNNSFYINQGTGEFVVGPDKEWEE